jgi:hypothetical protein
MRTYDYQSNRATPTCVGEKLTHVVSFSGGRSSAVLVYLMEIARQRFNWRVKYIFCDTGVEHPQTYRFIRNMVKFWGIDLIILRLKVNPELGQGNSYEVFEPNDLMDSTKMPPFQPFFDCLVKYGVPTIAGPYCSERMKKDVFNAYCKDHFGKGQFVTWLGMRSDEPTRTKPKEGIRYLADLIDIEKADVIRWWKKQPFDLELDEFEGNCLFCVKKSTQKIAAVIRTNPNFYLMWKYYIKSAQVRIKEGYDKNIMYRGHMSLNGISTMYEGYSDEEIISRLISSRREDVGSCSESCEAFHPETELDFKAVNESLYLEFSDKLSQGYFQLELI